MQMLSEEEYRVVKKQIRSLWFILIVVSLASCASLRKAELASGNDPHNAIAEVAQIMVAAQQDQIDVLADEQFSKGGVYLKDAKRGLKQGDSSELVLENAAIAKAFFEDARETAQARKSLASRILTARASALAAGVRKSAADNLFDGAVMQINTGTQVHLGLRSSGQPVIRNLRM